MKNPNTRINETEQSKRLKKVIKTMIAHVTHDDESGRGITDKTNLENTSLVAVDGRAGLLLNTKKFLSNYQVLYLHTQLGSIKTVSSPGYNITRLSRSVKV